MALGLRSSVVWFLILKGTFGLGFFFKPIKPSIEGGWLDSLREGEAFF
jgi:hypothetical protein